LTDFQCRNVEVVPGTVVVSRRRRLLMS